MKHTVIFDMHKIIYRKRESEISQEEDKGMSADVEEMPHAIDTFLSFYEQNYKIVIISTSIIQHSRDVLEFLLKQHGVSQEKRQQIFKDIDILTMQYFGTKYDSEAWKEAMSPYQNIEYIFEDGENKLKAAGQAARELGSHPELYSSISQFVE
jgi:hypothetical protein